jgi:hypothetical protein
MQSDFLFPCSSVPFVPPVVSLLVLCESERRRIDDLGDFCTLSVRTNRQTVSTGMYVHIAV